MPTVSDRIGALLRLCKRCHGLLGSDWAQRLFQVFWVSFGFVFVSLYLSRHWQRFSEQRWQIGWPSLALAVMFFFLLKLVTGIQWGLLAHYRRKERNLFAFFGDLRVYFIANLAVYIPGGSVWLTASRLQLNSQRGQSVLFTSTNMVYEGALFVWSGCLAGSYIAAQVLPHKAWAVGVAVVALIAVPVAMIHPPIANILTGHLKKRIRIPADLFLRVSYLEGLLLLVTATMTWLVGGIGHFYLARALYDPLTFEAMPGIASAFALAWVAGYLTPLAPSGIGVREAILVALLTIWVPTPIAVVLALASRLLLALQDLCWAGLVWLLGPRIGQAFVD